MLESFLVTSLIWALGTQQSSLRRGFGLHMGASVPFRRGVTYDYNLPLFLHGTGFDASSSIFSHPSSTIPEPHIYSVMEAEWMDRGSSYDLQLHRRACCCPPSQGVASGTPESWVVAWTARISVRVVVLVLPGCRGMEAGGVAFCQVVTMSVPPCCHKLDRMLFNTLLLVEEAIRAAAQACWWAEQAAALLLSECAALLACPSAQTVTPSLSLLTNTVCDTPSQFLEKLMS